ncbi:hypothetical protein [Acidocella sp.]|uniref:hypothetical protein n=1 Tax=Acidocella sp. TaxID=50710 RepID=UPI003D074332
MMLACNRQGVNETSGSTCFANDQMAASGQVMRSAILVMVLSRKIRPLFVLGGFVVVALYGAFLAACVVLLYRMGFQKEVLSGGHQLPQKDFGLFWCAGNGLTEQLAHRFGFHVSAAYRQICQNDILTANAPVAEAWPYPPTMGF